MPQNSEAFFKGIALSSIHEEATFFDVVQEWKFSRSTARSLVRRRRVYYGGLPPSLARFFLLLSFLRIIGCNYIKVETYNTRHLALPPSLPPSRARPTGRHRRQRRQRKGAIVRNIRNLSCHSGGGRISPHLPSIFQEQSR